MAVISKRRVRQAFQTLAGGNTTTQGRALEEVIGYVFSKAPGVEVVANNSLNVFNTEEVDVAIWVDRNLGPFAFLPNVVLIECKNWSAAVGTAEVAYFSQRLRHRGCELGLLVAANGITGDPAQLTAANFQIAHALAEGRRILVLTRADMESLANTDELARMLKRKICELTVTGAALV